MDRKVKIEGNWMVNTEFIHKHSLTNQISLNNSRPVSKVGRKKDNFNIWINEIRLLINCMIIKM